MPNLPLLELVELFEQNRIEIGQIPREDQRVKMTRPNFRAG
jgi:hypothetical protein